MEYNFNVTNKGGRIGQKGKGIIDMNGTIVGVVKYRSIYGRKRNIKYPYNRVLCMIKGPRVIPWDYVVATYQGIIKEAKKRFPNDKDYFLYGNFTLEVSETGEKNVIAW